MVCASAHFLKIMFVITISILFALSNAARLDNAYLPPNAQAPNGLDFLRTPNDVRQNQEYLRNGIYAQDSGFPNRFDQNERYDVNNAEIRPERPQAAFERSAGIIRQDVQNDGESYAYAYETENGIVAEENGVATNGVEAQGGFSYMGDDGQVYSIRYTADQNGFVPQGDHLPTPPPIPEEIVKALEQNARDEAAGIYDDGSYNEAKYGDDNQSHFTRGEGYRNEDSVVTNAAGYDNQLNYGNPARTFGNQGVFGRHEGNQGPAEASNTYLPPKVNQRTEARFENRNGDYSSRNGYRY